MRHSSPFDSSHSQYSIMRTIPFTEGLVGNEGIPGISWVSMLTGVGGCYHFCSHFLPPWLQLYKNRDCVYSSESVLGLYWSMSRCNEWISFISKKKAGPPTAWLCTALCSGQTGAGQKVQQLPACTVLHSLRSTLNEGLSCMGSDASKLTEKT